MRSRRRSGHCWQKTGKRRTSETLFRKRPSFRVWLFFILSLDLCNKTSKMLYINNGGGGEMARPSRVEEVTKMTLYLPNDLHRKLKVKAAESGVTMSAIIEAYVRQYVEPPVGKGKK